MAHELETQNGVASFASFREPAWHGLGTVFTEEKNTAEMLVAANLNNWNVRLVDVEIPNTLTSDKSYQYVVRTNPTNNAQTDVLGVVGERYVPVQNEELFAFGDNILDGGGRWETAGSIRGGRVVFGSLALERETVLDPTGVADKVKTYLLINTSHDGSIAIARETLGLANKYMDAFDIMAKAMIEKEITAQQFNDIVLAAYPKPDSDKKIAITKWTNKIDVINDIYTGEFNGMIANTAWGAFNALTERLDWHRNARGNNNESLLAAASGFDATITAEKNRLLSIVRNTLELV